MANDDRPNGLKPIKHLDGSPWNGMTNIYYIPSSDGTAVFVGDAVKLAGSADADGVPTVAQAAAGDTIVGVVTGIKPDTDEGLNYRAASTAAYVYVCDAPDVIFECQEDSVGGALAAADVGNNVDLVVGTGSTAGGGRSAMELDSSTKVTSTAQIRVLRLSRKADNEIGTNAVWEVLINEHQFKTTSGA